MRKHKTPSEILWIALAGDYRHVTERASAVLQIINQATDSERLDLLEFLVTNFRLIEDKNADISRALGTPLKEELYNNLSQMLMDDLHLFINDQMTQNPTPRDFGQNVWTFLGRYQGEAQVAACAFLMETALPYARLDKKLWLGAASEKAKDTAFTKISGKIAQVYRLLTDPTVRISVTPALATLLRQAKTRAALEVLLANILVGWSLRVQLNLERQAESEEEATRKLPSDSKNGAS